MERVHVVVAVIHPFDDAEPFLVSLGESSREPFGRGGQHRVVEPVALFVFFYHLPEHPYRLVERVPSLGALGVALAVERHHGVVPADEPDAQRALL